MSDSTVQSRESLSAMMDGEASEFELRKVLQTLAKDSDLRKQWLRNHIAGACIRKELLAPPNPDLCNRIQQALEKEANHTAPAIKRFVQPLSRFAVAASVAALAIVGVQQYNRVDSHVQVAATESDTAHREQAAPVQLPSTFTVPRFPVRVVNASSGSNERSMVITKQISPAEHARQQQIEAYLNTLMLRHTENSALNGSQGMLPFARMPISSGEQP